MTRSTRVRGVAVLACVWLLACAGHDPATREWRAAKRACLALQLQYAQHRDAGNLEAYGELFTEDARVFFGGNESVGRPAILEGAAARMAGLEVRHLVSNPHVEVLSADLARGISLATVVAAGTETPRILAVVEYEDRYRRTDRGWRIAERRTRIVSGPGAAASDPGR